MFLICTKTKTIQKISSDKKPDNVTTFDDLNRAKMALIAAIQTEITGLKIQSSKVAGLTLDDVSQTSFF